MCGIAGEYVATGTIDMLYLSRAKNEIARRGPDDSDIVVLDNGRVGLVHTRLAIIDLNVRSRQPMSSSTGRTWISFNGEIYNYKDLKKQLTVQGVEFRTESDTEVILAAYEKWGLPFVSMLDGIFAFALWDSSERVLLLARDRIGVKPLYFWHDAKRLVFGSVPRAILCHPALSPQLDKEGIAQYLTFGYCPTPSTGIVQIRRLPPGTIWKVCADDVVNGSCVTYWRPKFTNEILDAEDARKLVEKEVTDAVKRELVSDVPVGVFLSGGIDSSIVAATASESYEGTLHTFTLGFDEASKDERKFAADVANFLGTEHHVRTLTKPDFIPYLLKYVECYDEPFYDSSGIACIAVSELARSMGVKVVLSGDGGDEIFVGYPRYEDVKQYADKLAIRCIPLRSLKRRLIVGRYVDLLGLFNGRNRMALLNYSPQKRAEAYLAPYFGQCDSVLQGAQLADIMTYLPDDILTKMDRASMYNGVEVRVPLLNYRVVEAALRVGEHIHYKNRERKWLLRKVGSRVLPSSFLGLRKKGFSIPIKQWLDEQIIRCASRIISNGMLVASGVFRRVGVECLIRGRYQHAVWLLMAAELWMRKWFNGEDVVELLAEEGLHIREHTCAK